MKIWKWTVDIGTNNIMLPDGAQILDVQMQKGQLSLWALCDETASLKPRSFEIYGTGHNVPKDHGRYVATFQMSGGDLVFHFFERHSE